VRAAKFAQGTFWVLFAVSASGCAGGAGSSVTLPSSAYFDASAKEREALQVVSRAQESRRASCQQNATCEELTYTRGLVALFENREDAINVFQELRTTAPNSRYASSSARWISILQGGEAISARQGLLFLQLRQEILQGLLEPETLAANHRLSEQERRLAEMRP
jgi:hypothetical protein